MFVVNVLNVFVQYCSILHSYVMDSLRRLNHVCDFDFLTFLKTKNKKENPNSPIHG